MTNQHDQPSTEDTLARALLSFCSDGTDHIMTYLIAANQHRDCEGPQHVWSCLLEESTCPQPGSGTAAQHLEKTLRLFAEQTHLLDPSSIHRATHQRLQRWLSRVTLVPHTSPEALYAWLSAEGKYWIIAPNHPYWPQQLRDLQLHGESQTPLCLWGQGAQSTLTACARPVAIVGSRELDIYGRQVTQAISQEVGRQGHVVISGGAIGADACAHHAALSLWCSPQQQCSLQQCTDIVKEAAIPGLTVAVFAGGLNHIGPSRNMELFETMLERGGVLLSELSPDTIPEAHRFLVRNRIIAALAGTLVVTQARMRSGALNTAHWANTLCREVYAVPGMITSPNSAGCNALIRDHRAEALTSPDDIPESILHQHSTINATLL
jgi:DNA processing protein